MPMNMKAEMVASLNRLASRELAEQARVITVGILYAGSDMISKILEQLSSF